MCFSNKTEGAANMLMESAVALWAIDCDAGFVCGVVFAVKNPQER